MIISRTPLRLSFVGGGTDLLGFCKQERGAVVSTTIKKYVYIVVHPSFNKKNLIAYTKREETDDVDKIENTRVREAMKMTGVTKNIEIHSLAEVPAGTGLGSSSSFTVGLLNALYAHQGKRISPERLAKEACEIEIDILKEPIGRQDQYAAAFGGINKIDFIDDQTNINPLICDKETKERLEKNILLFYLGGQREASSILSEQNENLRNDVNIFEKSLMMRNLADEMEKRISSNNLDMLGELFHKNWELKQKLAESISNPSIERYYNLARQAGASGGKIVGAGGSGFLMIYAEQHAQDQVRNALRDLEEMKVELDSEGSKIIYIGDS